MLSAFPWTMPSDHFPSLAQGEEDGALQISDSWEFRVGVCKRELVTQTSNVLLLMLYCRSLKTEVGPSEALSAPGEGPFPSVYHEDRKSVV